MGGELEISRQELSNARGERPTYQHYLQHRELPSQPEWEYESNELIGYATFDGIKELGDAFYTSGSDGLEQRLKSCAPDLGFVT